VEIAMVDKNDPAYWRAKAVAARSKARSLAWQSDPELRQQTRDILAMPVFDRLRMIEENANVFNGIVRVK
jgi:hypothetical protein